MVTNAAALAASAIEQAVRPDAARIVTDGALAKVPIKVGIADGMNRPGSIFDVTVPRFNNQTLNPITNWPLPYGTTQGILLYGVGSKGVAVYKDIRKGEEDN